jgi:hypothetical protein
MFAQGARGLVILRASVTLSDTTNGNKRAFALAGKVFPTEDADEIVPTANFFAVENFLGTDAPYFLDGVFDNEPEISGLPAGFGALFLGLRIRADLDAIDEELSPGRANSGYRPVDGLARAGHNGDGPVKSPCSLRLSPAQATPRVDEADFRDELALLHYPNGSITWTLDAGTAESGQKADVA